MIANFRHKLFRERRKYPIKRDKSGQSARRRAFDAFDQGLRPAQVALGVGISLRTARRYFVDWKKHGRGLEPRYRFAKRLLKNHPEFSEDTITMIGEALDMSVEEVVRRLEKPWGIKQLLMGKWPDYAREASRSQAEARLQATLEIVHMNEMWGIPPERQREVLETVVEAWLDEAWHQRRREADTEKKGVKEQNVTGKKGL